MEDFDKLLAADEIKSKEAKFNLFFFQHHLLDWISISAHHFHEREYSDCFESLIMVYTDTRPFFNETQKGKIDKSFEDTQKAVEEYLKYNIDFQLKQRQLKTQAYLPPQNIYTKLIKFRMNLMEYMTLNNLTIPRIKKSHAGAGSQ